LRAGFAFSSSASSGAERSTPSSFCSDSLIAGEARLAQALGESAERRWKGTAKIATMAA